MSLSVNYNAASSWAHRNLQGVDGKLTQAIGRLSSGQRVQRAGDDPASMVLANSLRYHLSGLDQATRNCEEGVSMLQTAEAALDETSGLLNRLKSLMVEAANDGVQDPNTLNAIQDEVDTAIASITRVAGESRFGDLNLLDGTVGGNQLTTAAKDWFTGLDFNAAGLPGGILKNSPLNILAPAPIQLQQSHTAITLGPAATPPAVTTPIQALFTNQAGTTPTSLTLTGAKGVAQTIAIDGTTTINDVLGIINSSGTNNGLHAQYQNGTLTIASTMYGGGTFSAVATDAAAGVTDLVNTPPANVSATVATPQTVQITYSDLTNVTRTVDLVQQSGGNGLSFINTGGAPEPAAPYTAYDLGAFTLTVKDTATSVGAAIDIPASTGYGATRASTTSIQTGALAGQRVEVDIPDMRANALGFTAGQAASGFATLQSIVNRKAVAGGQAQMAMKVVEAAINEVTSARGRLGAIQSNGIESAMSALGIATENLSDSESRLRDIDMAQESSEYTRYNVMYQAATAMLAQANQTPQTVLEMLKNNR